MKVYSAKIVLFVAILSFFTLQLDAEPVSAEYKGLTANANLIDSHDPEKPFFLVLHGTFASHNMEIIQSVQDVLDEAEYNSLAFTLTLNLDNRSDFLDCKVNHTHAHFDALDEIDFWFNYVKELGFKKIVLLAHSRGGNQMANFLAKNADDKSIVGTVLIAPMTWDFESTMKSEYKSAVGNLKETLKDAESKLDQEDFFYKKTNILYCEDAVVSPRSIVGYYADQPEKDTPIVLKSLDNPVMVVIGTEDKVVAGLKDKITEKDNIDIMIVDGADHFFRDLYMYDIVDHITGEFLGE